MICTIHQPSSETFNLFDDVFWLANGSLVYSGPVAKLTGYFKTQVRTSSLCISLHTHDTHDTQRCVRVCVCVCGDI